MEEDYDRHCLEEKILNDILSLLSKNPTVNEFEILPSTQSTNRSPILYAENCLAIESWCLKSLYFFCYKSCFKLRKKFKHNSERLARYSLGALLINPDVLSFWNLRKQLIEAGLLNWENDIQLSLIILRRKPKCVEALAHRRWIFKNLPFDPERVNDELTLSLQLASKVKSNYHAWTHRQWVMRYSNFSDNLLLKDLKITQTWTEVNVSDHSGWQYRQFLFSNLNLEHLILCLNEEMSHSNNMILLYPGHESLWSHRRFLLQHLQQFSGLGDLLPTEENFLEKIRKSLNFDESQKWLVERHITWTQKFL